MTGLDKILSKISEEAILKCGEIDAQAKKDAQELWEQTVSKATAEAQKIVSDGQKKADYIVNTAKNAAESAYKKECLKAKNDIINDVIAAAYEKLVTLPDKDYFDVIISLCAANAQKGVGILKFNKTDLKRLPADFSKILEQTLDEGMEIKVSNIAVDIADGFLLTYGDVEVNCTFHALFDSMHDELKDTVCPILF